MIFRGLSRLIILVIGIVVLAELVSKDEPETKSDDSSDDADATEVEADEDDEAEDD